MDVCQEEEGENSIASSGASIICDRVIVVLQIQWDPALSCSGPTTTPLPSAVMPVPIHSNPTDTYRVLCRNIEEWLDLYGMSPIKPNSVRAFDKVPPTLQYVAIFHLRLFTERIHIDTTDPFRMDLTAGSLNDNARLDMTEELAKALTAWLR